MNNWFSIANDAGTAYVHLFSDVGCYGEGFADFEKRLGSPSKIELTISSDGGDADCGLRLFELLRNFDTEVLIAGKCHSAALTVAMAGRVIRMNRGSRLLAHPPSVIVLGTPEQLRKEADTLEGLTARVRDVLADRAGQPKDVVAGWLSKDTWFEAQEALAAGLVDEVVEPPPMPRLLRESIVSGAPTGPTDAEKIFGTWLTAFGELPVRDKAAFGRDLAVWFNRNVNEK